MSRSFVATVSLAAFLTSCQSQVSGLDGPKIIDQWQLGSEPSLVIESDSLDLRGIGGIRRLGNGNLLVANNTSSQLLLFSPDGRILHVSGGRGEGPGDFSGPVTLFGMPGDSTLALDGWYRQRWSVVTPEGRVAETKYSTDPMAVLYGTAVISNATTEPIPQWVFSVLDQLGATASSGLAVIEASIDDIGALWVRQEDQRTWKIYHDTAGAVGEVNLPPNFDWFTAGNDYVAGVALDSLDVPRIELWPLKRSSLPQIDESSSPQLTPASMASPIAHKLLTTLRNLMTGQEAFFAGHDRYTNAADSMNLELEPGIRVTTSRVDESGYLAVAIHDASHLSCGVVVGGLEHPPLGWMEGQIVCSVTLTPSGDFDDLRETLDSLAPPAIAKAD